MLLLLLMLTSSDVSLRVKRKMLWLTVKVTVKAIPFYIWGIIGSLVVTIVFQRGPVTSYVTPLFAHIALNSCLII